MRTSSRIGNLVRDNLPFVTTNAPEMMVALGDPTRQAIFDRLAEGPMPVGELAATLPISRPAVSQHLRVLKDVGLVVDRAVGTRRLYQVDPEGLLVLRAYLDQMWERSLAAFRQATEDTKEQTP
jgi:DNA-binding transcriptional ArsR family regulator